MYLETPGQIRYPKARDLGFYGFFSGFAGVAAELIFPYRE
jgi:hypothetical protein